MSGFLTTIAAGPHGKDVVVVLYSEFGRRVAANGSQGTDHGTAANIFVAGAAVNGGMFGDQPSLTDLTMDDLKYNVDFRSVYATVLEGALSTDAGQVLGAATSRGSPSSEPPRPPSLLLVITHKFGNPSASGYQICA